MAMEIEFNNGLVKPYRLFKNKNAQTPTFRRATPPPPPIADEKLRIPDIDYESPVSLYLTEMRYEMENDIYKAVQGYGVTVDKDELIKALTYDRQRYDKGYEDGMKHFAEKLKEWFVENSNYWFSHTVNAEIDELLQTEWK